MRRARIIHPDCHSEGSRVLTNYAELIESYEVRSWAWLDLLQIEKEIRKRPLAKSSRSRPDHTEYPNQVKRSHQALGNGLGIR